MNPPTLPAAPWQPSPIPDSRAIITPDGYFLLNIEGLHYTTPENADALRRAVAALPAILEHLERFKTTADNPQIADANFRSAVYHFSRELLHLAGYTATVPQNNSCV